MIICYQEQTKGRGFPSARSVLFLCRVISWIICGELAFIEMLAAKSDIFVIGAKHDLGTFSDNAMLVVAGVADCFAAAERSGRLRCELGNQSVPGWRTGLRLQSRHHRYAALPRAFCRYLPGGHRGG